MGFFARRSAVFASSTTVNDTSLVGAGSLGVSVAVGVLTTAITLVGAGSLGVSAASGVLTTQITPVGAGSVTISTASVLTTAITPVGAGTVTINGSGVLTTAITPIGAGTITVNGSGVLSTAIPLVGAGTITIDATGTLAAQGADLTGAAALDVTGSGDLTTAIALAGSGTITVTADSDLTAGTGTPATDGWLGAWLFHQRDWPALPKRSTAHRSTVSARVAIGRATAHGDAIALPLGVSLRATVGPAHARGVQNLSEDAIAALLLAADDEADEGDDEA